MRLFLVLLAVVGGALFYLTRPAVQRGYVLRLLHTNGIPVEIGAVQIGLTGAVSFEKVALDLPEGRISCQRGSAKLELLPLLENAVRIHALKFDGLTFDLTQKKPAAAVVANGTDAAKPAPAAGAVRPEMRIYIDSADGTDGSVILPDGQTLNYSVHSAGVEFAGGDIGAVNIGQVDVRFFVPRVTESIAQLKLGRADMHSLDDNTWELTLKKCPLTLLNALFPATAVPDWRVTGGTVTGDLSGRVISPSVVTGQLGKALFRFDALSLSRHGQPWLQGISGEILPSSPSRPPSLNFTYTSGRWRLYAKTVALRAGALPLLDGTGEFTAAANGTDEAATFDVTATVHGDGLAVQPAWEDTLAKFSGEGWRGNFVLKGQLSPAADGTDHTPRLLLTDASVTAARGESVPLLRAELLQDFDSASPVATDGTPFLRVSAESFPLPLATPFLDGVQLGGVADGTVELTQTDKRLRVATAEKTALTLKDFSYTDADGSLWLDGFHLQSGVALAFDAANATDGLWELNFVGSKVDAGDGHTLAGDVALAWDGTGFRSFRAQLEGDPARLLRQPLLGGFSNLASARLVFDGTYTRGGTFGVAFTLANIAGADGLATLRKVTLNAAGTEEKTLSLTAATATLEGETRTSDLTLAGQGAFTLESAQLDLADIERLAVLFAPHPPAVAAVGAVAASAPSSVPSPQKPSVPSAAKPDKKPFWHSLCELGVETFSAKVDAVHVSPLVFGAVAADGKVQPDALVLEKFFARVADGTAGGQARLDFRPTAPTAPYALDASASLRALPFKSSIALLAPGATDTVEGSFDIAATLTATAPHADAALWENGLFRLRAESRNGRVRIFKMDNDAVRAAGELADIAGGVAEIVSGLTPSKRRGNRAAPLLAFRELQKTLDDFSFEQARIRVRRDPDGSIALEEVLVANDQLSITGGGAIVRHAGLPLMDSPLNLHARLNAREPLAELLRQLKLLQGDKDASGFFAGPGFEVGGSLNSLQNDLLATLLKAAQESVSHGGKRLLGERGLAPVEEAAKTGAGLLRDLGL